MSPKAKKAKSSDTQVSAPSSKHGGQTGEFYLISDHSGNPRLLDKHGAEAPPSITAFLCEEPRLKMSQWFVSAGPDRVAFMEQGVGIGFIDFHTRQALLDVGNDKLGDEFAGVAVASDGALWVCASENGQSYGVIVDPDGTLRDGVRFGPSVLCDGSDDGDFGSSDFEPHSAISVASLAPYSTEMVVSSHLSELWVYQNDGTRCPRNIALPRGAKSWTICAVSRSGVAPLLVCIVDGDNEETAAHEPATSANGNKRFRKALRTSPPRRVVVLCADTAALVKVYNSWPSEPVDLVAQPDGSVAVVTVDSLLQIWPATAEDVAVRPFFLAPTAAQRYCCRPIAVQITLP